MHVPGNWESGEELGDTWASRNAYSYGRCATKVVEAFL